MQVHIDIGTISLQTRDVKIQYFNWELLFSNAGQT